MAGAGKKRTEDELFGVLGDCLTGDYMIFFVKQDPSGAYPRL